MRRLLLGLAFILLTANVLSAENSPSTENESLDRVLAVAFEEYLTLHPSLGARIADPRYVGRITVDLTEEHQKRQRAFYEKTLTELGAIDRDALDNEHLVYHDAVSFYMEVSLEGLTFPNHLLPLLPGFGTASLFAQVGSGSGDLRFDKARDYDIFLQRLDDFEVWVDAAIANLKKGVREGVVHPRSITNRFLGEIRNHAEARRVEQSVFRVPLKSLPGDIGGAERQALEERFRKAVEERVLPAYKRLYDYIKKDYLKHARESISLSALPNGDAWYRWLVRFNTTTEMTPDEIFEYGNREVSRIKREMNMLRQLDTVVGGFSVGMGGFGRGDLMSRFAENERIVRKHLSKQFNELPKTPLEVRAVEAFRESSSAGAFYETSVDGIQPGVFYVNLKRGPRYGSADVLFLHEALPGHHMQIALARENEKLPGFLRYINHTAFIEGWGLYCESLGRYLGLYQDSEQDMGRLRYALGRASRLVADVGIHHKGWSYNEARGFLQRRNLNWAVAEIERYTMMPGQALSYKIGERQIQELRRKVEKAMGNDFDPRVFHTMILEHGPLPLAVLSEEVERQLPGLAPED